jgi:hypothetical protein
MKKQWFLTPIQEIAVNLVFKVIGEQRNGRTQEEYATIAAKLPPLKVLVHQVNELLQWMHQRSVTSGIPLPLLCRFKAGDERYAFEEYPRQISYETVRKALQVFGIRPPREKLPKSF